MSSTKDFHDFCKGYVHAALWSSNDNADDSGGEPLDANYSEDDIRPESLRKMKNECAKFFRKNRKALKLYAEHVEYQPHEGSPMSYAGHDFWLTAKGHGAGFWDREGIPKVFGEHLSKATKKFESLGLYEAEDGTLVYE